MRFSLAPREERFFEMFDNSVEVVLKGARLFNEMIQDYTDVERKAKALKEVELDGDQNTHRLMEALNRSFVTPIDRDDIHALNSELDDILDFWFAGNQIHNIVNRNLCCQCRRVKGIAEFAAIDGYRALVQNSARS